MVRIGVASPAMAAAIRTGARREASGPPGFTAAPRRSAISRSFSRCLTATSTSATRTPSRNAWRVAGFQCGFHTVRSSRRANVFHSTTGSESSRRRTRSSDLAALSRVSRNACDSTDGPCVPAR
jgi:hypothetical protein